MSQNYNWLYVVGIIFIIINFFNQGDATLAIVGIGFAGTAVLIEGWVKSKKGRKP